MLRAAYKASLGHGMKITYRDLGHYFANPPGILELTGDSEDKRRARKGEILIIITAYHDRDRLKIALAALSKQNFRNFDVAVIYGKEDSYVYDKRLSILHVRRKTDLGSCGAVYLGQMIAFREGYVYTIGVDVDLVPASPGSLKQLYETAESGGLDYVKGNWDSVSRQPTSGYPGGIVRTSILAKSGLYPLPLYLGFDDLEFHYRLMKASRKCRLLGEPTHARFANSVSLYEAKLIRLLRKGGVDTTYAYANLIGNYTMPEVFFDLSAYHPFAEKSFFLRRTIQVTKFIFIANLYQRLFELRMPALREYRLRARKSTYAVPVWKDCEEDCEISAAKKSRVSFEKRSAGLRSGFSAVVSGFLKSDSPRLENGIYLVLYDSCRVWEPSGPTECTLKWTQKASLAKKIGCVILASADTLDNVLRAAINIARRRHSLDGYGVSALSGFGKLRGARSASGSK